MSKFFLMIGLALTLLAACSPVAPASTAGPAPGVEPTATREPLISALQAARQALVEQSGVAATAIETKKVESSDWPDACLGLPQQDETCNQVITPGFDIVFSAAGTTYEYRTDMTGNNVRQVPAAEEILPAAAAARQTLMQQRHLGIEDVSVADVEEVEWPDGCLGVAVEGMVCTMAIVPGYRVMLEAGGQSYVYHTNVDGSNVLLAEAPESQLGAPALTWRGIETPCQEAQINENGVAFGLCGGAVMDGSFATPEREEQLQYFVKTYRTFTADTKAGKVTLNGSGLQEATISEQRAIAEWARLAVLEAVAGRPDTTYGLALTWHREGGIAGFCDDLSIYVTGEAYVRTCKSQPSRSLGYAFLSANQLEQVFAWLDTLQTTDIQVDDPAAADAMMVHLTFNGLGEREMTEKEKQTLLSFAANLYATIDR